MKRPRSFMVARTLLILTVALFVAVSIEAGRGFVSRPAHAGVLTTRVMDPRAGDPDEPSDGTYAPGDIWAIDPPASEPIFVHDNHNSQRFSGPLFWLRAFASQFLSRIEGRR